MAQGATCLHHAYADQFQRHQSFTSRTTDLGGADNKMLSPITNDRQVEEVLTG